MWVSYFLLPFFLLLVLDLLDGRTGWGWTLALSALSLGLLLHGGYHFALWSWMFLLLLGLLLAGRRMDVLRGIGFSLLLGAPRLLPAALTFWGEKRAFIGGYPSAMDLLGALVDLRFPAEAVAHTYTSLGWWELDLYVGLIGLAFLCAFGIFMGWKEGGRRGRILLVASLLMIALAIGRLFQPFAWVPVPLAGAERVSSRFVVIPLTVLIMLSANGLQRFLSERRLSAQALGAGLLAVGVLIHDLLQHARIWRVENMDLLFPRMPVDLSARVLTKVDPPYVTSLVLGLATASAALLFLLLRWRSERGQVRDPDSMASLGRES
jgi:hypothetical protein